METSAYTVVSIVIDVTLIVIVGLAVLLMSLLPQPFRRGFYCNDETIYYPYKSNTVSTLAVALVGLLVPIAVIAVTEWFTGKSTSASNVSIGKKSFPRRVVRSLRLSGVFLFGAGASQVLVDVSKYWIGRLRPHFLAICQPDVVCTPASPYKYITDYTCQGSDIDAIEEARLSFPSGHAALAFYAAVFTVMYLQCGPAWNVSRLLRHAIQFFLLLVAWWTALTRVSDYFHHWSDVLAGAAIGSLVALLNVVFVSDLRRCDAKLCEQEQLPLMTNLNNSSSYVLPNRGDQNNV